MTRPPIVEFDAVQKTYDGKALVVRELNLAIAQGEFLTLLGPSGSGKTTVLMMLAGFEAPTGGEIRLRSKSINRTPPHRRDIGMVFQNYALFPHMTVAENVGYPLAMRRTPRAEIATKVHRALEMIRLPHLADRRPSQLSGGQQQRVALARALIFQPELVLMDEPLGALDKNLREEMQYEIKRLHVELGLTVVYVTHDQTEALTMSDRVAVFNGGIIEQIGSPADLYERPTNPFVADFIGENNHLRGVVETLDGVRCRVRMKDGALIDATAIDPMRVGIPVVVTLRPEKIHVCKADSSSSPNLTIDAIIYHGDHLRLSLSGWAPLIAKVPTDRSVDLRVGASVSANWSASDCLAFVEDAV